MEPNISLVILGVVDVDESIRFYRDELGVPMRNRDADGDVAFFTLDGTWLSVFPRDRLVVDATVPDDGSGFSGITLAHNVATRDEVDGIPDRIQGSGGRLVKPAETTF